LLGTYATQAFIQMSWLAVIATSCINLISSEWYQSENKLHVVSYILVFKLLLVSWHINTCLNLKKQGPLLLFFLFII